MLTVREVADELRISSGVVYRMINDGSLQCHRFGTAIRISRQQLNDLLENAVAVRKEVSEKPSRTLRHL